MARVLFVENRSGTYFSAAIARRLVAHGHSVAFVVQNHAYSPAPEFESFVLPYPGPDTEAVAVDERLLALLRSSDRGARHFAGATWHYGAYQRMAQECLDAFRPDVVFGEVTLFHEHLVSHSCELRGIPYLMPTHARYPQGRFAFYQYARPMRVFGSGECPLSQEALLAEVEAIRNRRVVPDYVRRVGLARRWLRKASRLPDLAKIWLARLRGERFNTPSLAHKRALTRGLKRAIVQWDELARPAPEAGSRKVLLFPLQMQPETNIESWGYPFSDQAQLMEKMSRSLPDHWTLWVKANPSPKYELSTEMIRVLRSLRGRVAVLPRSTPMAPVFERADAIVTVTGTVGIEALFANKPLAAFQDYFETSHPARFRLRSPEDVAVFAARVDQGGFPPVADVELAAHLRRLYCTSYPGMIAEPVTRPDALDEPNLLAVSAAYLDAIAKASRAAGTPPSPQLPLDAGVAT